jgi:hypothetical protein
LGEIVIMPDETLMVNFGGRLAKSVCNSSIDGICMKNQVFLLQRVQRPEAMLDTVKARKAAYNGG